MRYLRGDGSPSVSGFQRLGTDREGVRLLQARQGADGDPVISRFLALLSAVLAGLLAGGMILLDVVLLPFWRGVPPAEFRTWFAAHSDRIRALMIPLGAGAAAVNAASAVVQTAKGPRAGAASVGRSEERRVGKECRS